MADKNENNVFCTCDSVGDILKTREQKDKRTGCIFKTREHKNIRLGVYLDKRKDEGLFTYTRT